MLAVICGWLFLMDLANAQVVVDTAWVRSYARTGVSKILNMELDTAANIYVAFRSNDGDREYFAAVKHDSTGQYLWNYQSVRGNPTAAVIDSFGNTYMTGQKWDSYRSESMTLKISSSGAPVYVNQWINPNPDGSLGSRGSAIACDNYGNAYVTGAKWGSCFVVTEDFYRYNCEWDIFAVGYSAAGTQMSEFRYDALHWDESRGIALLPSGDIYIASTGFPQILASPGVNDQLVRLHRVDGTGGSDLVHVFNGPSRIDGDIKVDGAGNAVINMNGMLVKVSPSDSVIWERGPFIGVHEIDGAGDIIGFGGSSVTKFGANGDSLWTVYIAPLLPQPYTQTWSSQGDLSVTDRGIFISGGCRSADLSSIAYFFMEIDTSGSTEWLKTYPDPAVYSYDMVSRIATDDSGNVFVAILTGQPATITLIKFIETTRYLNILDGHGDSIPNVEFNLIKVTNNPPYFDEDTLGAFTTDDKGQLELTPIAADSFTVTLGATTDTLVVGDNLKIAKYVRSVPAVKHQARLGTMYSVHLDNMQFAEDGQVFFDTLTSGNQDIILNHTELRYNLLVSVEWEATDTYLWNLEDNFRRMSNYLYDVTDGQVRLDTVLIWDKNQFSSEADVLILASNMEWPRAHAGGILRNGIDYLYMPRIWMGDSTRARNHTDAAYPLDLTNPSTDYRTKAHEFGHYALNFFDEYLFWHPDSNLYSSNNDLRCLPPTIFRYGFMDSQYENGSEMSSELSGAFRYDLQSCRNTNQWRVHHKSCWEHLESWVEAVPWGTDNLFVPILKPDASDTLERVVSNPAVFFAGPNNDLTHLDYDVGIMAVFPNRSEPQAVGHSDKHVIVHHSTGGDNADVELINDPMLSSSRSIKQGRTSDMAGAWVVGVKDAAYQILASKGNSLGTVTPSPVFASPRSVTTGWLYGMAEAERSGASRVGNRFTISTTADSITIELNEVRGYYPLISRAILTTEGVTYDLTATQAFPSDPSVELLPSYGGSSAHPLAGTGDGYAAIITDSLGPSGSLTLWATDDSSNTFFVPNGYVATGVGHNQPLIWLFAREGQSEFRLDSTNVSITKAMILSSPYPVTRTGLAENAVQAGQTHCLSVYPDNPLAGANQVVIRYDDADLKLGDMYLGDESSLAVYHWIDAITGWTLIGGTVDTVQNTIYAPITQTGVYAAFTTQIITDVADDEHGDILPYRFDLSQNYPNPFNPVTTIKYSLPQRSYVTIEVFNVLGQKVRTLVDREESAGSYSITWDGTGSSGQTVSTGVYLYRFQAGEHVETKKMLLLK